MNRIPNEYESRDDWLRVGMAVHSALGSDGFSLWGRWAREHESYNSDDTKAAWRSFGNYSGREISAETQFAEARKLGPVDCSAADFMDDPEEAEAELLEHRRERQAKGQDRAFQFITPGECRERRGSRPYIVKGLLGRGDVAAIVGQPGAGKSLLGPRLAYAVAQGRPVFDMKVRQAPVFYVAAEDSHGMQNRVAALCEEHGEAEDFKLVLNCGNLLDPQEVKRLCRAVQEQKPGLIIIDTLAMAFAGLEQNGAASMGRVVSAARSLTAWGAAVILIHHDTKSKDGLPRGHSILNGALDMSLHLTKDGETVFGRPSKNRNGSTDCEIRFSIATKVLGHDEDGDEIRAAYAGDDNSAPR
ncbi:AAA family ATPase [Pseudomonas sp. GX19020]|uniref:AAA family ATPase n=1 Tax=Pseudomonas sp. GX19020 TaxID=2942277 RepID=UPI00201947E8|nr:AAA family ATPase [Pseudomonas sp. GX19020]MCL4068628.1 AAA family ATPase [Pseudomonas sp. GX19020]